MSSRLPVRNKKSKTHSAKPYDRPKDKSLVQKVKNLIPTWLGLPTWLTGSDNTVTNVTNIEDSDDSDSDEQEEVQVELGDQGSVLREPLEDFQIAGPSGINTHHLNRNDLVNPSGVKNNNYDMLPTSSLAFARGPLHRTSTQACSSLSSANAPVANGDDQSDNSETSASTSGCSSLAPSHQEKRRACLTGLQISEAALDHIRNELTQKKPFLMSGGRNTDDAKVKTSSLPKPTSQDKQDVSVSAEFSENEDNDTPSTQNSLWSEDDHINTGRLMTNVAPKRAINSRPQPLSSNKRPCFNVSAFGAPTSASTREALFDGSLGLSPFYDSRCPTFGGASAYRRARINSQFPYKTDRAKVNVKEKANRECMSSVAKKILNTLERMSTPLQDAKKIPTESHSTELALSFMPGTYRRKQPRVEHKISHSPPKKAPPTSSFASPTPVTIGRNLQPMFQIDKRKSGLAPAPPPMDFSTPSYSSSGKAGGKIRATTSQPKHFSNKPHVEDEMAEEPNLPQIPLPIVSLPTFNFKLPPNMTSTPAIDKPSLAKSTASLVESSESVAPKIPIEKRGGFMFSAPIQPKTLPQNISWSETPGIGSLPKFSFSSPSSLNETTSNWKKPNEGSENFLFGTSTSRASPVHTMLEISGPLKTKDNPTNSPIFAGGIKPAANLVIGGSVMDILLGGNKGKEPNKQIETSVSGSLASFGQKFKPAPGSWECSTCMIRNKVADTKCVACETPKSKTATSDPTTLTSTSVSSGFKGFGDQFKPATGSWECSVCMVNNKANDTRCIACETPKPGSVSSSFVSQTTPIPIQSQGGFSMFIKPPPSGSWECDTCLVRNNDASMTKCQACETPRVGSIANSQNNAYKSSGSFQFGKSSNNGQTSTFKFGLPVSSIVSSSTTSPASSITSGFVFGTPAAAASATTGSGFKFGVPNTSASLGSKDNPASLLPSSEKATGGFVFGASSKTDKTNALEATTVMHSSSSNFVFGSKPVVSASSKTTGFSFGTSEGKTPTSQIDSGTVASDKSVDTKTVDKISQSSVFGSRALPVSSSDNSITSPKNSISGAGTLANPTSSAVNVASFSFNSGKNSESGTEFAGFGTTVTVPKTKLSTSTTDNGSVKSPGLAFGSSSSSIINENKNERPNIIETKVGAPTVLVTSTTTLPTTGFQFSFGGSVPNVEKVEKSSTTQSTNLFNFRSEVQLSVTKQSEQTGSAMNAPSLFSFGASPAVTTQSGQPLTPSGGFVFGGALNKPVVTGVTTTSFNFNANSINSSAPSQLPIFGSSSQQQTPAVPSLGSSNFAFGTTQVTKSTVAAPIAAVNPSNSVFKFGVSSAADNSNQTQQQQQPNTSLFSFGAGQVASTGIASSAGPRFSSNPSFQFGNSNPSSDSSVFRFGGSNQAKLPNIGVSTQGNSSSAPSVSFGSIGMAGEGTQPLPFGHAGESGFAFQTGSTGFNFGTATPNPSITNANPQLPFTASGDNPFNGTAGNTANRKIRKAVRRVNKK